ncbi:Anaphase-promoting complex subunit 1, partial [Coemansia spiralis]
ALLRAGHQLPSHGVPSLPSSRQRAVDSGPAVLPSLARWALATLDAEAARAEPFPSLSSIGVLFGIDDAEPAYAAAAALKLLSVTADILYHIGTGRDAALVFRRLASDSAPSLLVQQLSPDIQWLVAAIAERLQQTCLQSWPANILALLGRHDVPANAIGMAAVVAASGGSEHGASSNGSLYTQPADTKDVVELCDAVLEQPARDWPGSAGPQQSAESHEFSLLAFSRDLRLDEAERLLDSSGPTYTTSGPPDSDAAGDAAKKLYLAALGCRVLALAPGQSLLRYSTRDLNPQDALAIRPPVVHAQFRGQKGTAAWDPGSTDISWPLFHSGVAAALAIERNQLRQAHPSWVLLNWPAEPALDADAAEASAEHKAFGEALASHAGFLLGMGLLSRDADPGADGVSTAGRQPHNGPLCNMPPWQAFKYLSRRNGLTSIALLLGCACAHRGTMNGPVNKILSLHIPNLLPPGSSELMLLSYGTQAAAMLGLGLLFMRSQNRRMVEVLLHELASARWAPHDGATDRLDSADPAESSAECYSLAAGFALGLVALGRGMSARTLADLHLLDSLSDAMSGASSTAHLRGHAGSDGGGRHEAGALGMLGRMSISAPAGAVSDLGTTAAIGLVFLGTNYDPAAQRLALPQAEQSLRTADPFGVLWKVLMRSLIMLDDIHPTAAWVESNAPRACARPGGQGLAPDLYRMRLHVVTAACFAIALKYVGTEDARAHAVAFAYFDELEAVIARPSLGYESSLTRAAAQSCLDAMGIAAALVMAGSGDVATMKRLRALHSANSGRSYGNHMASHMALGLLFLGGGARFTIARSPESIALLLVSLFPRFPQHFADNHEHLQAWRPLWALCVVPRCLVVRDVRTGGMCRDAAVTLAGLAPDGANWSATVVPPVPFPSLTGVQTATVTAPGYLPAHIDLSHKSYARGLLLKRRVLYMQSSALSFPVDAAPALAALPRYQRWLADAETRVNDACTRLTQAGCEDEADIPGLASTVRAIERLRLCVLASRCALLAGNTGRRGRWAEDTYLAWLRVRSRVLEAGQTDEARRVLVRHWAGGQQSDAPPGGAAVVALLHAALDLPSPADAVELAKQIPLARLADHLLAQQ